MPARERNRLAVNLDGLFALRCALAGVGGLSRQQFAGSSFVWEMSAPGTVYSSGTVSSTSAIPRPTKPETEAGPRIPLPSQPVDPTDEQHAIMAVVARAQAGDANAFGELYDRYNQMVYRYIAYRCSNSSVAEDLTSETFLRALRRISSYTWQGRDFGAWLVTIARNLLADHYKSSRYRLEIATSDLVAAGAERTEVGPEDDVLTAMTNEALIDAIKQLGSEQQECIVLRFLQGMSVAETAVALGKNEGAIKALQYRAVKALGRLLPPELVA